MKTERNKKIYCIWSSDTENASREKKSTDSSEQWEKEKRRTEGRGDVQRGGDLVHGRCLCSESQAVMLIIDTLFGAKSLDRFMEVIHSPSCISK